MLIVVASYDRKYVVFGKLVQGDEVLKKIESVGDEEGRPTVTVKIINCGEFEGKNDGLLCSRMDITFLEFFLGQERGRGGKSFIRRSIKPWAIPIGWSFPHPINPFTSNHSGI